MVGHVLSWHKGLNLMLGSTEKETDRGREETMVYIVDSAERIKTYDNNRMKFQRQQIQLKCLDAFDCG